jgi:hypothetical protein
MRFRATLQRRAATPLWTLQECLSVNALAVVMLIACVVIAIVGNRLKRDRLGIVLQVLGIWGFANFFESNYPTDYRYYGYGCPFKWEYDPAFRYTGELNDLHAVTPQSHWKFDGMALFWNMAIGVGVLVVALIINEWVQISNGNRSHRMTGVNNDMW